MNQRNTERILEIRMKNLKMRQMYNFEGFYSFEQPQSHVFGHIFRLLKRKLGKNT